MAPRTSERIFAVRIVTSGARRIQVFSRLTIAMDYAAMVCRQGCAARVLTERERLETMKITPRHLTS